MRSHDTLSICKLPHEIVGGGRVKASGIRTAGVLSKIKVELGKRVQDIGLFDFS
jgi:hypothetical protein